ncbi:hypothetical protein P8C59_005992 [Phyllachora maydis]|uniref:Uncharacterized protein n=1 Tax=Phyllachora maydis TaxID=1825666 RepID=A0AAD9MCT9_9PEZI|nr:hypothetical protein P8C59_005992 [Phyllachora maydis]
MPKQYVVLGRPVPPLGPRRVSVLLVCLAVLAVLGLLCKLPFGSAPIGPPFQMADGQLGLPQSLRTPWINYLNPWKQPSHPPPRQRNDTDGESHWYSNRMWFLMPFSSSVTLDENRSLLPDLVRRTRIYCYYDNTVAKDAASKDAESDLLLIWRRAWWAHGFEPIILSPAEAMKNPRYEEVQRLEMGMHMDPALRTALMRWLAWEKMGGGLLADHLLFPMGPHHDPLLSHLLGPRECPAQDGQELPVGGRALD